MEYSVCLVELYSNYVSGFDTYKKELLAGLITIPSMRGLRIVLESPCETFVIETFDRVTIYQIPLGLIKIGESVSALLSMHIYDSPRTCFFLNFSPASHIARTLKEAFPKSRIIAVMHDFRWAYHLMGDLNRFRSIIANSIRDQNNELIHLFYHEDNTLFRLSDAIICLSQDSYDIISSIYQIKEDKLRLIPNGLRDLSQFRGTIEAREIYNIPNEDYVILYSGRVSPQKGIIEVFACFRDVLRYYPNSWLVIAGGGDDEIPPEIRSRVLSLGHLSQEWLFAWYRTADLGILPSFYEQCSYTGIEMKMFGLPIIASNAIGVRCMFGEHNSIVAKIGTYTDLSYYRENLKNAILQFFALPYNDRKALGLASRKHYEQTYAQAYMLGKYIDLIYEY